MSDVEAKMYQATFTDDSSVDIISDTLENAVETAKTVFPDRTLTGVSKHGSRAYPLFIDQSLLHRMK